LTFADAVKQLGVRDSGRSGAPHDDRGRFASERLHPKVANSRIRPIAEVQTAQSNAAKRPFSMAESVAESA
jgi:hypothetical protein